MKDKIFGFFLFLAALIILLLTAGIIYALVGKSMEAFREYGVWGFIANGEWDPRSATEEYGALSFIMGTLYTAFFALFICIPFSLSVALFNGEYFKGKKISSVLSSIVDLLAGIPSILYGLWGFYTVRPVIIEMGVNAQGFGIFL
ncbi:MAG: phosphate ABC transporter permease subunit PstC, partial [Proteiniphilum sp.]|nr:phosphate ABC transporter permease subunit PstC [Proteiniphilum sp.]